MFRATMSISSVPFVKGLKALQVMPSLRRNFGACSVLMVGTPLTDKIEKRYADKIKELSRADPLELRGITPEIQEEVDAIMNNFKKAHGLDKVDYTQFRTNLKDSFTQKEQEAKEDKVPDEENQSAVKQGIERVVEDIGKLLVSGKDSDITLQVGDVRFKAHRAILSARCPFLYTTILVGEIGTKGLFETSNSITIGDCEPGVFGDFLHYLYNGSAQRLSEENVFSLYRVADRYFAYDLMQQCLQHIRDTLSAETFCDVVRLAQTHGQSDLLRQAMEFATQNIRLIIRTAQWQNFIRDHPTEANAILIKALGPPS